MIKVLFICHGNICRSPMAEFILRDMVTRRGIAEHFHIASAATSTEEIWNGVGNPVYPPAREELIRHGIDCAGKCAIQFKREDYDRYDYLIGMDRYNMKNMRRMAGGDPEGKMFALLEFAGRKDDIADPWYSGDFGRTYRDIVEGLEGFLEYLEEKQR